MKVLGRIFIILLVAAQIAACSPNQTSALQTSVVGTLTAAPARVMEVTKLMEVTKVVQVQITTTPLPTNKATLTKAATPTLPATPTQNLTTTKEVTVTPMVKGTQTPASTNKPGTPLGLTLEQFYYKYSAMTDLQKDDFANKIIGKTVYWTAPVDNITSDGLVILNIPFPLMGNINLQGVPNDTAIRISKGVLVDFIGTVETFNKDNGVGINLKDVKILRFYPPETPTPTIFG